MEMLHHSPLNFHSSEGKDFLELAATRRKDWSGRGDLNSRPPAPKAGALPGCATPRHEVRNDYKALPNRTVAPSDQFGLRLCQNCAK